MQLSGRLHRAYGPAETRQRPENQDDLPDLPTNAAIRVTRKTENWMTSEWLPEWDEPGYVYEPSMPTYRNDVAGYWATCFDDFEAATRYWAMLMASFGMEPDDAAEYGMRRARDDGYIPDGYRRQPIERNDIATIKAQLRIEDEAEKLTRMRWTGNTGRGACPIHKGKNTSTFVVYIDTQSFNCFKCNIGGDVVTLLQQTGR